MAWDVPRTARPKVSCLSSPQNCLYVLACRPNRKLAASMRNGNYTFWSFLFLLPCLRAPLFMNVSSAVQSMTTNTTILLLFSSTHTDDQRKQQESIMSFGKSLFSGKREPSSGHQRRISLSSTTAARRILLHFDGAPPVALRVCDTFIKTLSLLILTTHMTEMLPSSSQSILLSISSSRRQHFHIYNQEALNQLI